MRWISCFAAALAFVTAFIASGPGVAHASGPVSVFGLIDKVTIEQPDDSPDAHNARPSGGLRAIVRIDGVFIVAKDQQGNYGAARRGYLYLTSNSPDARREWNDLQSVAGTRQVVAFGSRWHGDVRLRETGEKQESPDVYTLGNGVSRLNPEQARARELLEFRER